VIEVIRYAQIAPVPWKNGHGMTTQLAIHPPSATTDDFDWRISIAQITQTAPFSSFTGIERCLAVLRGSLRLIRERESVTLSPDSPSLYFAGDAAAIGEPVNGPVFDLNVMYRSNHWDARMTRRQLQRGDEVALDRTRMLCSLSARATVRSGEVANEVQMFDLLRVDGQQLVVCESALSCYIIDLRLRNEVLMAQTR
jgi:uncharacterized protein